MVVNKFFKRMVVIIACSIAIAVFAVIGGMSVAKSEPEVLGANDVEEKIFVDYEDEVGNVISVEDGGQWELVEPVDDLDD